MIIGEEIKKKLSERHSKVKDMGIVALAIQKSGIHKDTFHKVLRCDPTIVADSLEATLRGMREAIEETEAAIQNA